MVITQVKQLLLICGLLFAGWLMADSILTAIDREMEHREVNAWALRAEACGEGYAAMYADALRRAESIGGAVVHEPDCRVQVVTLQQAGRM